MTGFRSAAAIIAKDVRLEARRVENLATMAIFAVLVVVVFVFAGDPTPEDLSRLGPGALWVSLLFAGAIGFQRWFAQEERNGALQGLLLTPVDRGALFIGKWIGATLFLLAIEVVLVPVASMLLLPVLLFPLSVPILLAGAGASQQLMTGDGTAYWDWVGLAAAFDVIFGTVCTMTFEYVITE
jgi:heme exporter protein B